MRQEDGSMVSGWDKNRPPPGERYEPDIGWGGRLVLLGIAALVLFAGFGWLLV
jgi:hypothetical protein